MSNEMMLPPYLYPSQMELVLQDTVGQFNPMFGYAVSQRLDYGASRWKARVIFEKMRDDERHALLSFLNSVGTRKAFYMPIYGEGRRGSGTFTELVSNPTFESGTTGYTTGGNFTSAVRNRIFHAERTINDGGNSGIVRLTSTATVTLNAAYVGRIMLRNFNGSGDNLRICFGASSFGTTYNHLSSLYAGLLTLPVVAPATSMHFGCTQTSTTDLANATYFGCPFFSLAPCLIVDNGRNSIPYSDDFSNAAWTKTRSSIAATAQTLPDGSSGTTNTLHEDSTAANNHFVEDTITISALTKDIMFSVAVKPVNRSWIRLLMTDGTSAGAYFNVTTGALGVTTTGAAWTNTRSFISSMGNGWYQCTLISQHTGGGTSMDATMYVAEADNDIVFTGLNQDSLAIWRATVAQFGVTSGIASAGSPSRLYQTTGTADDDGVGQAGASGCYVRGGVVSSSLLNAGDFVNVMLPTGHYTGRVSGQFDTDAAGMGFLALDPPLPSSPDDGAAVVINLPFLKCVMTGPPVVRTTPPSYQSNVEFEVQEVFG